MSSSLSVRLGEFVKMESDENRFTGLLQGCSTVDQDF
jgi:hypothetical protein